MIVRDSNGSELAVGDRVRITSAADSSVPAEVLSEDGLVTEITQRFLVRVRLDVGYPLKKPIPPGSVTKITREA